MNNNKNKILVLLEPSSLVAVLIGVIVLLVEITSYIAARGDDSALREGLFATQEITSPSVRQVGDTLARNDFTSNLPLFLLYAAAGAIIYCLAVYVYGFFEKSAELRAEMEYVNARPQEMVRSAFWHLVRNVLIIGVWLGYGILFFKQIVPFVLSTAYSAYTGNLTATIWGVVYTTLLLASTLYIHVVLYRLLRRSYS